MVQRMIRGVKEANFMEILVGIKVMDFATLMGFTRVVFEDSDAATKDRPTMSHREGS